MSEGHEADDGGEGGADPRLELMEEYTLKTMKIKNDKWKKVYNNNNKLKQYFFYFPWCKNCNLHLKLIIVDASNIY